MTKNPTAEDHFVVVFKQGKLEPSYKITDFSDKFDTITNIAAQITATMDNLTRLRAEYDTHVTSFITLRRNFNLTDNPIEKFFGKKNFKPDEVKTTLADITTGQQKSTDDIQDIYSHLGVWADPKTITESIAIANEDIKNLKTIIDLVEGFFPREYFRLDKLKLPNTEKKIKSLPHVVAQGVYSWIKDVEDLIDLNIFQITGIYRITLISEHQFNMRILDQGFGEGVNTISIVIETTPRRLRVVLNPVDATVIRESIRWFIEYVSAI